MASSFTVDGEMPAGGKRITYGSFTNSGSETGLNIYTGLQVIEAFDITIKGTSVQTNACTVNATFPVHGASGVEAYVPIVCDAGVDGYWRALGW